MTRSLTLRIMGAALVLVALLIGLVVRENQARNAGREVRLPMEAVDPRELLTGHYVALQLRQLQAPGEPCPPFTGAMMKPGWVALTPGPAGDRVTGVGSDRPSAARFGPIQMRGKANCWGSASNPTERARVSIDIGVRRFHASQEQAEAFDRALRERRVGEATAWAIVSVGEDGKARLKGVIVGGQRADLGWD